MPSQDAPTTDTELNTVLNELVAGARAALGSNLLAAYLQGSFGLGAGDIDSDVDFLVAIHAPLSDAELAALQALHARVYDLPSNWAKHLEGSYFPANILKDPARAGSPLWYLNNTDNKLVQSAHDNTLVVRWLTREHGIPLFGPPAPTLIDPVPVDALKQEVRAVMLNWGRQLLDDPTQLDNGWRQPFAVLSYCRMLHTLATGRIESKPASAEWAKHALDPRWRDLIERAWADHPDPTSKFRSPADPPLIARTRDFIHYVWQLANLP